MAAAIRAFVWRNSGSDRLGREQWFDDVWLSEHHFIADGDLGPTKRIRIASAVLLMPFHNPVRWPKMSQWSTLSQGNSSSWVWESARSWRSLESFGIPFKERGRRGQRSSWCC